MYKGRKKTIKKKRKKSYTKRKKSYTKKKKYKKRVHIAKTTRRKRNSNHQLHNRHRYRKKTKSKRNQYKSNFIGGSNADKGADAKQEQINNIQDKIDKQEAELVEHFKKEDIMKQYTDIAFLTELHEKFIDRSHSNEDSILNIVDFYRLEKIPENILLILKYIFNRNFITGNVKDRGKKLQDYICNINYKNNMDVPGLDGIIGLKEYLMKAGSPKEFVEKKITNTLTTPPASAPAPAPASALAPAPASAPAPAQAPAPAPAPSTPVSITTRILDKLLPEDLVETITILMGGADIHLINLPDSVHSTRTTSEPIISGIISGDEFANKIRDLLNKQAKQAKQDKPIFIETRYEILFLLLLISTYIKIYENILNGIRVEGEIKHLTELGKWLATQIRTYEKESSIFLRFILLLKFFHIYLFTIYIENVILGDHMNPISGLNTTIDNNELKNKWLKEKQQLRAILQTLKENTTIVKLTADITKYIQNEDANFLPMHDKHKELTNELKNLIKKQDSDKARKSLDEMKASSGTDDSLKPALRNALYLPLFMWFQSKEAAEKAAESGAKLAGKAAELAAKDSPEGIVTGMALSAAEKGN